VMVLFSFWAFAVISVHGPLDGSPTSPFSILNFPMGLIFRFFVPDAPPPLSGLRVLCGFTSAGSLCRSPS